MRSHVRMGFRVWCLGVLLAAACVSAGWADSLWDLQAVDATGAGTYRLVGADPVPENMVTVEGVALAGWNELLDPSSMYSAFIQDTDSDRGGLQAWSGRFYYGALWRPVEYIPFAAGDRLRITGLLEDHNGKVFINDRHTPAPDTRFTVEILSHPGMPDPVLIPSVSHCNYFDSSRQDGGERWQTRWVMLHGLQAPGVSWTNGSQFAVSDSTGQVQMLLSQMGDFAAASAPAGKFSAVGVFDQEDTAAPFLENYRLWVKRSSDMAEALDACREVTARADGARVALAGKVVSRAFPGEFYVQDADRSGGVRVVSDRSVSEGERVAVMGAVRSSGAEKFLADDASAPLYVVRDWLGGAPQPLFVNGRALRTGSGLSVQGLLVRCVARVGEQAGLGLWRCTADTGDILTVDAGAVVMPAAGTFVVLTGIIAPQQDGGVRIRIAGPGDIQVVQQGAPQGS